MTRSQRDLSTSSDVSVVPWRRPFPPFEVSYKVRAPKGPAEPERFLVPQPFAVADPDSSLLRESWKRVRSCSWLLPVPCHVAPLSPLRQLTAHYGEELGAYSSFINDWLSGPVAVSSVLFEFLSYRSSVQPFVLATK